MSGDRSIWGISVLSAQFCYEPKTSFKNKAILKYVNFISLKRRIVENYLHGDWGWWKLAELRTADYQ